MIEVMVTTAIFALAIGAVTIFAIMTYRGHAYALNQAVAVDEARKGVETMVRELREARKGDDGSYIIEKAADYEIIFYSDIDKDGATERVRYFVYQSYASDALISDCVTFSSGGSCTVNFPNFTTNAVNEAEVEVCVEGDLNSGNEYVEIYADGSYLDDVCRGGCHQCHNAWEGCTPFDVTDQASDGSISFIADGSNAVGSGGGGFCDWEEIDHSLKAHFNLSWSETAVGETLTLYKGVIQPTAYPVSYPAEDEEVTALSKYVLNDLPIFRYYDGDGIELTAPARLEDTKLMRVHLVVNVNPERPPQNFELESNVQIRNLKTNQ